MILPANFSENILRNMLDILIVVNPDATVKFANSVALDVLGYDIDEIEGMPVGRLFDDSELHFFGMVKKLVSEGVLRNKGIYILSRDGEKIPVVLNGSLIRDGDNNISGMALVARDMREIHQLVTELAQMNDDLEERVCRRTEELQSAKEASEDALRRLQQTQSQLVQSDKMASVGQLAAGIAHEINNPAGFVLSNLNTLEEYIKDIKNLLAKYDLLSRECAGTAGENISSVMKGIEEYKQSIDITFLLDDIEQIFSETQEGMLRISKIVKDLREFSHTGSDKPEYADINKGLESTLNIVWNELKYKAEVTTLYGDIPHALCYPQQLNQVFMNILVNASQAIEEKGLIKVRTFAENSHVVVEISDTGKGIPSESLSRIFEPFFTTKPVGKGTGLGLSVAYAIVRKHGGEIKVDSEVGRGTSFNVIIPVESEQFKKLILPSPSGRGIG